MSVTRFTFAPVLVITLCVLGACSKKDNPVIVPEVAVPGFSSPDLLVFAYQNAHENMSADELGTTLAPGFQMRLQPTTIEEFPAIGATLDRAAQMRIAPRMFSGTPLTDPDGVLLPAITGFDIVTFEQQDTWTEVPTGRGFAGSRAGLFDVVIVAVRPGHSILRVEGQLIMYVAATDTVINDTSYSCWQMVGMDDLTGGYVKANETVSWGALQASFWVAE